ncbi:MAG: hypothetical protein L0Y54_05385 [Sporichthyaceae bacterium]|nr:hypothetical protein [Sporichthyaceae bacterium]
MHTRDLSNQKSCHSEHGGSIPGKPDHACVAQGQRDRHVRNGWWINLAGRPAGPPDPDPCRQIGGPSPEPQGAKIIGRSFPQPPGWSKGDAEQVGRIRGLVPLPGSVYSGGGGDLLVAVGKRTAVVRGRSAPGSAAPHALIGTSEGHNASG